MSLKTLSMRREPDSILHLAFNTFDLGRGSGIHGEEKTVPLKVQPQSDLLKMHRHTLTTPFHRVERSTLCAEPGGIQRISNWYGV